MQAFSISDLGPSPFLPGFRLVDAFLPSGIRLRAAVSAPAVYAAAKTPLMMVHGHPHNHLVWRKVAPQLANERPVVLPDLRGYGDSDKPASDAEHRPYSKRVMADDLAALAKGLGWRQFDFVGHDRGGRVGHRLMLDHAQAVRKGVFVDIAPTATMYARTDMAFASRYFWWFFLIQPYPFPEKLIASDPAYFVHCHIDRQNKIPGAVEPEVLADYVRCYSDPAMEHAVCEDYRAAATVDLADDAADADKRITAPLLLLWGEMGTVGKLYDVVETWREKATDVRGRALPCGHSPEEEVPEVFLSELQAFLDD